MTAINIIFDGPPSDKNSRFVEIENDEGTSVRVGTWAADEHPGHEGLWRLRISLADLLESELSLTTGADLMDEYDPEES